MFSLGRLIAVVVVICSFIRTFSYAIWVWRQKNRLGAIAVMAIAFLSLAVPIYVMFLAG